MNPQVNKNIHVIEQPADKGISHKGIMIFKQLRVLRWPDMLTLLGLLCVSFSVYFSFKGFLAIAYVLILMQFLLDYFDGKLARAIGGGALGVYLDSCIRLVCRDKRYCYAHCRIFQCRRGVNTIGVFHDI